MDDRELVKLDQKLMLAFRDQGLATTLDLATYSSEKTKLAKTHLVVSPWMIIPREVLNTNCKYGRKNFLK